MVHVYRMCGLISRLYKAVILYCCSSCSIIVACCVHLPPPPYLSFLPVSDAKELQQVVFPSYYLVKLP